ncbi:membrane protein [Kitasatospora sp. MMS16-BH015]|uniref:YrdB family protein n=1 Tax=Kitasatospora sp. MMS16-BH015 TaxID=2018025 RepID=UPI000CA3B190|nr:YrdB family protein [Kitasatospora sp. MMS16-BH015]AUG78808.1 membrane protein [Kitasatospora sp. MMS16-BH015]
MGFSPVSLGVRFLLELSALAAFGYWGFKTAPGGMRVLALIALPIITAVLWTVFATPGDPSRNGGTVIATPGPLRFVLELVILFGAAWALYNAGAKTPAMVLLVVLVIYHLTALDRVFWLFRH